MADLDRVEAKFRKLETRLADVEGRVPTPRGHVSRGDPVSPASSCPFSSPVVNNLSSMLLSGHMKEAPNIVVIVMDQERDWDTLPPGFTQDSAWFKENLPNRHELYKKGVTFSNNYISAVPCTPSRGALYTGQHFQRTGVFQNFKNLPPKTPTLGSVMAGLGYQTAYKGKWHLTELLTDVRNHDDTEQDVGTDEGWAAVLKKTPPYWDAWLNRHRPILTASASKPASTALREKSYEKALQDFGFEEWNTYGDRWGKAQQGWQQDPLTTEEAITFMESAGMKSKPFFIAVNFINPHDCMFFKASAEQEAGKIPKPWLFEEIKEAPPDEMYRQRHDLSSIPSEWLESREEYFKKDRLADNMVKFESHKLGKIDTPEARQNFVNYYLNCMRDSDRHIGGILTHVKEMSRKAPRDTVIILTSDHGEMMGQFGLHQKGALLFDGNIKCPLRIAEVKARSGDLSRPKELMQEKPRIEDLSCTVDLIPSLVGLVGKRADITDMLAKKSLPGVKDVPLGTYVNSLPGVDLFVRSPREKRLAVMFQYAQQFPVPQLVKTKNYYTFLQAAVIKQGNTIRKIGRAFGRSPNTPHSMIKVAMAHIKQPSAPPAGSDPVDPDAEAPDPYYYEISEAPTDGSLDMHTRPSGDNLIRVLGCVEEKQVQRFFDQFELATEIDPLMRSLAVPPAWLAQYCPDLFEEMGCPNGHKLEANVTHLDGQQCHSCSKQIAGGDEAHVCLQCQYYLCRSCAKKDKGVILAALRENALHNTREAAETEHCDDEEAAKQAPTFDEEMRKFSSPWLVCWAWVKRPFVRRRRRQIELVTHMVTDKYHTYTPGLRKVMAKVEDVKRITTETLNEAQDAVKDAKHQAWLRLETSLKFHSH